MTVETLQRVGFTDHAIERFAMRAGLTARDRASVEPILRGLLVREGRIVTQRPRWSRSRSRADLYLQVGDWMLFIAIRDERHPGRYTIVTAVNGASENSWRVAHRRGYVNTPPPVEAPRSGWLATVVRQLAARWNR